MRDMFSKTLVRGDHRRSFNVGHSTGEGWRTSEGANERILCLQIHHDWHAVERVLERFNVEIAELRRQGWRES